MVAPIFVLRFLLCRTSNNVSFLAFLGSYNQRDGRSKWQHPGFANDGAPSNGGTTAATADEDDATDAAAGAEDATEDAAEELPKSPGELARERETAKLLEAWQQMDTDGSGSITFEQFAGLMRKEAGIISDT